MNIRRFFLVSLALSFVAVGLQISAMSQTTRGLHIRARALSSSESERAAAQVEAANYSNRGAIIGYIGFPFVLGSVAFFVLSARRHEPAWRSLVLAVLFFYVMLN